jgi:hypothetical protein
LRPPRFAGQSAVSGCQLPERVVAAVVEPMAHPMLIVGTPFGASILTIANK